MAVQMVRRRLEAMSPTDEPIQIRDEMIRLGQLLKLASLVDDGQQAREVITAGYVSVNGETVTQRGRQLRPGDVVEFAERAVEITAEITAR